MFRLIKRPFVPITDSLKSKQIYDDLGKLFPGRHNASCIEVCYASVREKEQKRVYVITTIKRAIARYCENNSIPLSTFGVKSQTEQDGMVRAYYWKVA